MAYVIGRPINGCFLNDLEFVLDAPDPDGAIMTFDSADEAREYLINVGYTPEELDADIDSGAIQIKEIEEGAEI